MKAQAWSLDFSLSVVIFVSIAIVFLFGFNTLSNDASKYSSLSEMQNKALELSETLVRTQGYPIDWNANTVKSIGLSTGTNRLNDTKVRELLDMDYNLSKTRMGIWGYDYEIKFTYSNGTMFNNKTTPYTKGPAIGNQKDAIHVERYIILNNRPGRLRLILWR